MMMSMSLGLEESEMMMSKTFEQMSNVNSDSEFEGELQNFLHS